MSNVQAPSVLDASVAPAQVTSQLDASQLDKNLRQIDLVHNSWSLPQLPDAVKLDLASQPGVDHVQLNRFLTGINSDMNGDGVPDSQQYQQPTLPNQGPTGYDTARRIFAGVANQPPPTVVSGDAVKTWKMAAIDGGYLPAPADGQIDDTWSPDYEATRKQMAYDQTNASYRGDRIGSLPLSSNKGNGGVLGILDKWTNPGGLMAAATKLDLWWDAGAISKEITTWGDKWRKLGKSKNPWDFARNLVDAVTGPIDDIVLPAVNMALLLSGVSEAYDFGKIAMLGKDALTGEAAVTGLYDAGAQTVRGFGRFTKTYEVGADYQRMGEASGLATRMARADNGVASFVGDQMKAWREFTPVKVTKKLVQTGMKLGVVQQGEAMLPNFHGSNLPGQDVANKAMTWAEKNPIVNLLTNTPLFAPYSTFAPGTFTNSAKGVIKAGAISLGTVPGRAVAGALVGGLVGSIEGHDLSATAEGALIGSLGAASLPAIGSFGKWASDAPVLGKILPKAVGGISDFLKLASFKPLTEGQAVTNMVHRATLASLKGSDKLAGYTDDFKKLGFQQAFNNLYGTDSEGSAAAITYKMLSAAIDHIAAAQTRTAGDTFTASYRGVRNKLAAQIRSFDLENLSHGTLVNIAGSQAGHDSARFHELLTAYEANPARAIEYASAHNDLAKQTIQQMLSSEVIPDLHEDVTASLKGWTAISGDKRLGIMESYLSQGADSFQNWPEYTARMTDMRLHLEAGGFDDALFSTYRKADGTLADIPRAKLKDVPGEKVPVAATSTEQLTKNLDEISTSPGVDVTKVGQMGLLAHPQDPTFGKLTLMLKSNPTEQDVRAIHDELSNLGKAHLTASLLGSRLRLAKTSAGGTLDTLSEAQFVKAFEVHYTNPKGVAIVKGVTSKDSGYLRHLHQFAKQRGLSLDDITNGVNTAVEDAIDDPRITDWLNLGKGVRGKLKDGEAPILKGAEALKERVAQLNRKINYTAAGIDHDALRLSNPDMGDYLDSLDRAGYKLVHGADFLTPESVAFHTGIFDDINRRNQNYATLGNFFKGREPAIARLQADTRTRLMISNALDASGSKLNTAHDGEDVRNIMFDLRSVLIHEQGVSDLVRDNARNGSWLQKRVAGVKTTFTPMTMADLRSRSGDVLSTLTERYGEKDAKTIFNLIPKMRDTSFKDIGLGAIEAKLRSQNQFTAGLNLLGGMEVGTGEPTQIAKNFLGRTSTGRKVGAVVGAGIATQDNGDGNDWTAGLKGAAEGALAGTAVQGLTSIAAQKVGQAMADSSKWFKYGYLADDLARFRDATRFSLSPFFDISRYTEGTMLGQTGAPLRDAAGAKIVMPFNMSPKKVMKGWAKDLMEGKGMSSIEARDQAQGRWKGLLQEMTKASHGNFNPADTDSVAQWYQRVGILGFNPTDWTAAAYSHLKDAGFAPEVAFKHAQRMYEMGSRSAAEMSVNSIFFPFSFQKKVYTNMARYLADDQSRAIMIHDAMKVYEIMDQKLNLSEIWKDKIPEMRELQKLNMFAYGASLGKFGGINQQFIVPVVNAALNLHGHDTAANGIRNLFSPHGISIKSAADATKLTDVLHKLVPAINDIGSMMNDIKQQGHVLVSPTYKTAAAEAHSGWSEWQQYKTELSAKLKTQGYTMADLPRKPWLAGQNIEYKSKQATLAAKYPGWQASRVNSINNLNALNSEKSLRLNNVVAGIGSESDNMMAEFEDALKPVKQQMQNMNITDTADLPPDMFKKVRDMGIKFGATSLQWRNIWKKFYEPSYGPIEQQVQT